MGLEMVLNELSAATASDVRAARARVHKLLVTARAAASMGVQRVLRTRADFLQLELAPGYPLARWRNDPEVDREAQRYLRSILTKAPLLTDEDSSEIRDEQALREFFLESQSAEGVGVAFLLDALALSFDSGSAWQRAMLPLETRTLHEDGTLVDAVAQVPHASGPEHLDAHRAWIDGHRKSVLSSGAQLWAHRREHFPSLDFCAGVELQLSSLGANHPLFHAVCKRLFELECYFKGWATGGFDAKALPTKATPESATTMQRHAAERTFECPDGQSRTFEWHLRLTPGAWRLYFIPDAATRRGLIGYVGPHLPTAQY